MEAGDPALVVLLNLAAMNLALLHLHATFRQYHRAPISRDEAEKLAKGLQVLTDYALKGRRLKREGLVPGTSLEFQEENFDPHLAIRLSGLFAIAMSAIDTARGTRTRLEWVTNTQSEINGAHSLVGDDGQK